MLSLTLILAASVFTASDMLDIQTFAGGQPIALSPDGRWVAYVLTDVSDEWNVAERRPTGHVYVQPIGTDEEATSLSSGATHSSYPVWSPDGRRLAFFVEDSSGGQLALWDRDHEGEGDRVILLGERFSGRAYLAPHWTPDGARVVYALAIAEEPEQPAGRVSVVRSSDARIPGDAFFVDARRARLGLVNVENGTYESLSDEPLRVRALRLVGDELRYRAPTEETFGLVRGEVVETYALSLDHPGSPRIVTDASEDTSRVSFRLVPDESRTDPEIVPPEPGMYTIARPFMDLYVDDENVTANLEDQIASPVATTDGESILFRAIDNETYDETIYRYRTEAKTLEPLVFGRETFSDLAVGGRRIVFTAESATQPKELFTIDLQTGERSRLTDLNPQLASFDFAEPELFHFRNTDGERLGALLYKPAGLGSEKVPVITYVYEKLTPGIHRFQARHQIFLSHGFAILMPNVKVVVGETASSFVKSVVPAVEAVREMGFTNGRFCLWGGSFGAYATSYVITQTNIFDCAVSRATPPELFRNWASGRDRDSENIERGQARMGGSPFEVKERYLSQSAFFHLDQVETPVLLLHGVQDRTILVGEGEMMFYALRRLGKEAELVLYRDGDHSLFRHSRADAVDVHQRMLDWFTRYLLPARKPSTR